MALIVEDGTGSNPAANSYETVANFRTYCQLRGYDLDEYNDEDIEVLLIKAMDYLEGQRHRYQGQRSFSYQPLQWPRTGVYIEPFNLTSTEIPRELCYGQLALAYESIGNDLLPNRLPSDTGAVIKEKVADLEVVYDSKKTPQSVPGFGKADALLSVLYKRNGLELVRS